MSAGKPQNPKPLSATLIPINTTVFSLLTAKPDHQMFSVSLRDIKQVLKPKKCVDSATLLPAQYHKFLACEDSNLHAVQAGNLEAAMAGSLPSCL